MINKGPNVLIVNSAAQAELVFLAVLASGAKRPVESGDNFGASYANLSTSPDTQTAEGTGYSPIGTDAASGLEIANADMLRITGFGDFLKGEVIRAEGSKGILPQKQVSSVLFAVSSPVAGTEVTLEVALVGNSFAGELASYSSDYKKLIRKTTVVKAGDTADDIANRFVAQFQSDSYRNGDLYLTAAKGATATVVFTAVDPRNTFTFKLTGSAPDAGTVSQTTTVNTPGFPGRNDWNQLSGLRLETVMYPYAEQSNVLQLPIRGAKYSRYVITKTVSRPDLKGLDGTINTVPVGNFQWEIYINEALSQYIIDLTRWLNANVPVRVMYTATTAAAAIAAENPTPTTAVGTTPYQTPLV